MPSPRTFPDNFINCLLTKQNTLTSLCTNLQVLLLTSMSQAWPSKASRVNVILNHEHLSGRHVSKVFEMFPAPSDHTAVNGAEVQALLHRSLWKRTLI